MEGITRPEDLPKAKLVKQSRNFPHRPCPRCAKSCYRDNTFTRTLHDVGDLVTGRPRDIELTSSQHYCCKCRKYFNVAVTDLAPAKALYTHRVIGLAVRLVVEDGLPYEAASWHLWRDHRGFVPWATIQNWVEAGGKKAAQEIETTYLNGALKDFSGYLAADELDDGPYCVLSLVDNRTFKRLAYEVLDHDPTHADIRAFFQRFQTSLQQGGLQARAITTDASPLYPEPIAQVFGAIPHQICEFHILKELTKAVLRAVAQVRKQLAAGKPARPRGRPSTKAAKRAARKRQRLQVKVRDLFDHRRLFVRHHLTASEQKILRRICRGQPHLLALRSIMDEVDRLFDRRCRTDTALAKLARLRQRVRRFQKVRRTLQKLFSPNLEKALTFLDDRLLPSTSNAVERGNRRHRKMQKTVYRVRTQEHIVNRIALDLLRDARKQDRQHTRTTLHKERAA